MADGKFTCEIEMGNDAMQTPQELAEALRELANRIVLLDSSSAIHEGHKVLDDNGNDVGSWELKLEPSEEEDDEG